jgi:hypothetical protein
MFADNGDPLLSALWSSVVAIVAAVLWFRAPQHRQPSFIWAACAYGLVAFCSLLWSVDHGSTGSAATQFGAALMLAWIVGTCGRDQQRYLAWAVLLLGAIGAAAAIRQALFGFPELQNAINSGQLNVDAWTQNSIQAGRVFGTFTSHDMLGGALAAISLLGVGLAIAERGLLRLAAVVVVIVVVIALALTRSVGAASSLIIAVTSITILVLFRVRSPLSKRSALALVGGAVVVAAFVAAPRIDQVQRRAHERITNQITGLRALVEAPIGGHGYNTFGAIAPGLRQQNEALTRYAHGFVGQTASDLGVVGLLIVALFLCAFAWRIVDASKPPVEPWRLGAAAAACAAFVHGLVDYDLLFAENLSILMVCLALALPPLSTSSSSRFQWQRTPVAILIVLVFTCATWTAAAHIARQRALKDADCTRSTQALAQVAQWSLPNADAYRQIARAYLLCNTASDRVRNIVKWSERARQANPRSAIFCAEHAVALAVAGDFLSSRQVAAQAMHMWPKVGRVYAYAGIAAAHRGEGMVAAQLLALGNALDPGDSVVDSLRHMLKTAGYNSESQRYE